MKLIHFFSLVEIILLTSLWVGGVSLTNLSIIFLLLSLNSVFQLWARGNVKWNDNINQDAIKQKIPLWAYSSISVIGLLSVVFYISKVTYGI